jgi:hypothetical protein
MERQRAGEENERMRLPVFIGEDAWKAEADDERTATTNTLDLSIFLGDLFISLAAFDFVNQPFPYTGQKALGRHH